MSDEHWLKELAQVKRDQEAESGNRLDERWDRLSAGTLSPDEEAELMALAATSEEAGEAYEAFRPLGPNFQAGVVQAIRKQGLAPQAAETAAKLLPFQRRAHLAGWSALTAAAAAAVLVLVLRPAAPLPDYASLDFSGGVSVMRGEQPEVAKVPVVAPGDQFQVVLRPKTQASDAERLEAQGFLSRGQDLRPLEVQSYFDPKGTVKMEGLIHRDLQPGTWTLWAVVGRRGKLPDLADLRRFSSQALVRQNDWVAVSKEIRIQNRDLPP